MDEHEAGAAPGDDQTLCDGIAAGDDGCVRRLYERYGRWSLDVALAVTRDHAGALDANQDAWWACVRRLRRGVTLSGRFTTYLYPFVRHAAMKVVRRAGQQGSARLRLVREGEGGREDAGADGVRAAVRALTPERGEVVRMRYWHGMTDVEIATALELPLGTVKGRLRAALRELAEGLEEKSPEA